MFVVAAGAAGVELVTEQSLATASELTVAVDLNLVPPAGIGGVEAADKATQRGNVTCYGPIGVGGTKMKIHKAAIERLFDSNDAVLDVEEIYALGNELSS